MFNALVFLEATLAFSLPPTLRRLARSAWSSANMAGREIDAFLEGPSFDTQGVLYLVDIPNGRVLSVDCMGHWSVVTEYDGWPNGLKIHRDGRLYIADYRRGLVRLDVANPEPEFLLEGRNSESFKGLNDLFFANDGMLYFTDQGQTGLHDPSGRVLRLDSGGRLDALVSNMPSPNGIVLNLAQNQIYVAATRGNAVWRLPLMPDGQVSKVGLFLQLSGGNAGPDGLALDTQGGLCVCQIGVGLLRFDALGQLTHVARSPKGVLWTNLAFHPLQPTQLYLVDSVGSNIHRVEMPFAGARMFSHTSAGLKETLEVTYCPASRP